jgi:hypothetical protein
MRKTLAVLSVLSILGSAGAALAEEAMVDQAVDPARTLTLEMAATHPRRAVAIRLAEAGLGRDRLL